jgi:PAS domain S-box-containing protein
LIAGISTTFLQISLDPGLRLTLELATIIILGSILAFILIQWNREKRLKARIEETLKDLKISETNYRHIFDNVHDGILIHDQEYSIVSCNPACSVLTGYSPEELNQLKILDLLPIEGQTDLKSIESNLVNNENSSGTVEAKLIKKDLSEVFVQLSFNPVRNENNSVYFQCTAHDVTKQKRMEENLHYYLKEVTRAQEDERKRIALELHDETVQYLIVLWRQLETLSQKNKELSPESVNLLQELREQTKNVIQSVRRLSQDLRPATLDHLGLLPALDHLASEISGYSAITAKVRVLGREVGLTEEVKLMLFRITQEALRNTLRHSNASQVEILVEFNADKVNVAINDNGKGFYLPPDIRDLSQKGKLGLAGMQERARLIDGQLNIISEPGKGTCVSVEVPVSQFGVK